MARHYPASGRVFVPYDGFDNAHADGRASIARLVGPDVSASMGAGIARYENVRTTWCLLFDEIIYVVSGEMIVRAGDEEWSVHAGDLLFLPREEPVEYDVTSSVVVLYTKYPA